MRTNPDIPGTLVAEARTGAGIGARGVSLFLVEAMWNEVACVDPALYRERLAAVTEAG
jgi:hypothetical protein